MGLYTSSLLNIIIAQLFVTCRKLFVFSGVLQLGWPTAYQVVSGVTSYFYHLWSPSGRNTCFFSKWSSWEHTYSGWWFGTWILFFHSVGYVIIPTDELIFFRGIETTNQYLMSGLMISDLEKNPLLYHSFQWDELLECHVVFRLEQWMTSFIKFLCIS